MDVITQFIGGLSSLIGLVLSVCLYIPYYILVVPIRFAFNTVFVAQYAMYGLCNVVTRSPPCTEGLQCAHNSLACAYLDPMYMFTILKQLVIIYVMIYSVIKIRSLWVLSVARNK